MIVARLHASPIEGQAGLEDDVGLASVQIDASQRDGGLSSNTTSTLILERTGRPSTWPGEKIVPMKARRAASSMAAAHVRSTALDERRIVDHHRLGRVGANVKGVARKKVVVAQSARQSKCYTAKSGHLL
jgi:hypothetical protein